MGTNINQYKHPYKGEDEYLLFFNKNTADKWSLYNFCNSFSSNHSRSPKHKSLSAKYTLYLSVVRNHPSTPVNIVDYIDSILVAQKSKKDNSVTINNYGKSTNTVNGDIFINENNHQTEHINDDVQQQQQQQQQKSSNKRKYENNEVAVNDDDEHDVDFEGASVESFDVHKRRKYLYNYTTSNIDMSCKYNDDHQWTINNESITKVLMKYRKKSIKNALKLKNLSDERVLSLSFVFLFTSYKTTSLNHHIPSELYQVIMNSLNTQQSFQSVPDHCRYWCADIDKQLSVSSYNELEKLKINILIEANNHTDKEDKAMYAIMSQVLFDTITKVNNWDNSIFSESGFIDQHLLYFLNAIFKNNFISTTLGERSVSSYHDEDDQQLFADYLAFTKSICGHMFYLFSVEVKPQGKKSNHQLQSDFVKIGKEMKNMMDKLIDLGISEPKVCGLLVEGYECQTFMMDLKYDGIYRMVHLKNFKLLRDADDITLIPKIVESLLQLSSIITTTACQIESKITHNDTASSLINKSFKRTSCSIPVKVEKEN